MMDKCQVASLTMVAELNNYVLTTHTTPVLIDGNLSNYLHQAFQYLLTGRVREHIKSPVFQLRFQSDRERPWRPDDESITCLFRSRQSKHRLHPCIAPVPGSAAGVRTLHLSKNVSGRLLCGGVKRPPTQSLLFAENKQPEQISHSYHYY
ncbi:uncharacterized protein LOC112558597 [Pomacea canaliculata]|uniref:uncharacterized protein LOC112558597 n=1 Tax=Pomacea canaliculata TaxID=400727 RepID=UPI000D733055|nr:uncharacterized protein LOC112558597 [Pomacea canaliculata]